MCGVCDGRGAIVRMNICMSMPTERFTVTHTFTIKSMRTHTRLKGQSVVTPWILFLIFVFGPCEPLIPLLIYPAATDGVGSSMLVGLVFGVATIGTMLVVVTVGCLGIAQLSARGVERFGHAICGAAVGACGAAMCLGL